MRQIVEEAERAFVRKTEIGSCRSRYPDLIGRFVVAGRAAGFAIHQAVGADANVELRLAQAAELIALAFVFRHFTLPATVLRVTGSGRHDTNLAPVPCTGNVPLVTL